MDLRGRWRRNAAAQGIFEDCEKFFVHNACLLNYYVYLCDNDYKAFQIPRRVVVPKGEGLENPIYLDFYHRRYCVYEILPIPFRVQ